MLAEKFFLVLETINSHASDGSVKIVGTTPQVPAKLPGVARPTGPKHSVKQMKLLPTRFKAFLKRGLDRRTLQVEERDACGREA